MQTFRLLGWNICSVKDANSKLLCEFMVANQIGVAVLMETSDLSPLTKAADAAFGAGKYFLKSCAEEPTAAQMKPQIELDGDVAQFLKWDFANEKELTNDGVNFLPTAKVTLLDGATHTNSREFCNLSAMQLDKPQGKKCSILAVFDGTHGIPGVTALSDMAIENYQSQKVILKSLVDKVRSKLKAPHYDFKAKKQPRRTLTIVKSRLDLLSLRRPARATATVNGTAVELFGFHAAQGSGSAVNYSGRFAKESNSLWCDSKGQAMPKYSLLAGDLNANTKGVKAVFKNMTDAGYVHASQDNWTAVIYDSANLAVKEILAAKLDPFKPRDMSDHNPVVVEVSQKV